MQDARGRPSFSRITPAPGPNSVLPKPSFGNATTHPHALNRRLPANVPATGRHRSTFEDSRSLTQRYPAVDSNDYAHGSSGGGHSLTRSEELALSEYHGHGRLNGVRGAKTSPDEADEEEEWDEEGDEEGDGEEGGEEDEEFVSELDDEQDTSEWDNARPYTPQMSPFERKEKYDRQNDFGDPRTYHGNPRRPHNVNNAHAKVAATHAPPRDLSGSTLKLLEEYKTHLTIRRKNAAELKDVLVDKSESTHLRDEQREKDHDSYPRSGSADGEMIRQRRNPFELASNNNFQREHDTLMRQVSKSSETRSSRDGGQTQSPTPVTPLRSAPSIPTRNSFAYYKSDAQNETEDDMDDSPVEETLFTSGEIMRQAETYDRSRYDNGALADNLDAFNFKSVVPGQHCVFFGGTGAGKTSFLYYMQYLICHYWDYFLLFTTSSDTVKIFNPSLPRCYVEYADPTAEGVTSLMEKFKKKYYKVTGGKKDDADDMFDHTNAKIEPKQRICIVLDDLLISNTKDNNRVCMNDAFLQCIQQGRQHGVSLYLMAQGVESVTVSKLHGQFKHAFFMGQFTAKAMSLHIYENYMRTCIDPFVGSAAFQAQWGKILSNQKLDGKAFLISLFSMYKVGKRGYGLAYSSEESESIGPGDSSDPGTTFKKRVFRFRWPHHERVPQYYLGGEYSYILAGIFTKMNVRKTKDQDDQGQQASQNTFFKKREVALQRTLRDTIA
jgi:hypothetical protein